MAISKEEQKVKVEKTLKAFAEAENELKRHRKPCGEKDNTYGINVISSKAELVKKGIEVTNSERAKLLIDKEPSIKAFKGGYQEVNGKNKTEKKGINIRE